MAKARRRLHLPSGPLRRFRLPEQLEVGEAGLAARPTSGRTAARLAWIGVVLSSSGLLYWLGTGHFRAVLRAVPTAASSPAPNAGSGATPARPTAVAEAAGVDRSAPKGVPELAEAPPEPAEAAPSLHTPPSRPRPPTLGLGGRRLYSVMSSEKPSANRAAESDDPHSP